MAGSAQTMARMMAPAQWRHGVWLPGLFLLQLLLLAWAAANSLGVLNPDAVAYLRVAGYYADGNWPLAVTGYWGPMLSWLIAVLLKLGCPLLVAARIVLAFSAVVFLGGTLSLFAALPLRKGALVLGGALAAIVSVVWSVENITPDLLEAGLALYALTWLLSPAPTLRTAALSGGFWGLAYLAKAVALPLGIVLVTIVAAARWFRCPAQRGAALTQAGLTLLVCACVAGPWIGVLSAKYGRLTVSTTAGIAHALAGAEGSDRLHAFARSLHVPEPGRVTSWEEPSRMAYPYWSAFESADAFRRQVRVCRENVAIITFLAGTLDVFRLGLAGAVVALVLRWCRRGGASPGWTRLVLPLALVVAVYLPVLVGPLDQRYLYVAWPLLFGLAAGALEEARGWLAGRERLHSIAVLGLLLLSFGTPGLSALPSALRSGTDAGSTVAWELATALRRAGFEGRIAGSGLIEGSRTGLIAAFLLGQPWLGDEPGATPQRFLEAGADLVILNARQAVVGDLDRDPRFRRVDPELFGATALTNAPPLRVYRVGPISPAARPSSASPEPGAWLPQG